MIIHSFETIILGSILALDACIVSLGYSLALKRWRLSDALKLSATTAFFQILMPLLGWMILKMASSSFEKYATQIDHWLVFVIFAILGGKIIKEAIGEKEEEHKQQLTPWILLGIGIGTSIDALTAGTMLFAQNISPAYGSIVIGLVTFSLVFATYISGLWFKNIKTQYLEILGGLSLILLGAKILLEHQGFLG